MRRLSFCFAFIGVMILASACAKPSLYQKWALQLEKAPRQNARLEDISLLLGSPPSQCDLIEQPSPAIGVEINGKKPVLDVVRPGGPAHKAGLQVGDTIIRVANEPIASAQQAVAAIRTHARAGELLDLETKRGLVQLVPDLPKTEQCYWEIQAGEVRRAGGATYINQWGGAAHAGGAAYQRFFRAACRVYNGYIGNCQANWQK